MHDTGDIYMVEGVVNSVLPGSTWPKYIERNICGAAQLYQKYPRVRIIDVLIVGGRGIQRVRDRGTSAVFQLAPSGAFPEDLRLLLSLGKPDATRA